MSAIDIGHGHTMEYFSIPYLGVEKAGVMVHHPSKRDGSLCGSAIYFDLPETREYNDKRAVWQVQSWEPLTVKPSLLCLTCGNHGFVTNGRWVPA